MPERKLRPRGRLAPLLRRVLQYDPAPAYARIADTADPLKRLQVRTNMNLQQIFPKRGDGYCDCGCGRVLTGRQRRWAEPLCARFAWYVYAVIAGRRREIRQCLRAYHESVCADCGMQPEQPSGKGRKRAASGLEIDHIVPVHRGGGACWLSNYRPLCVTCHRAKTGADRQAKQASRASC